MTTFIKTFLLLISSCISLMVMGQGSTFNSLEIPSSARIAALGGNGISLGTGDLNLVLFNPALLDSTVDRHLALSYVNYFSDVNLGYASYAWALDSSDVNLVASVQYSDFGTFDQTDETGLETGTFRAADYAFIMGASIPIDTNFQIGANAKIIYSSISTFASVGAAIDAGVYYRHPNNRFKSALLVRNLGYQLTTFTNDEREDLPFEIQLAFSHQLKHAPFRFTVAFENLQKWDLTYLDPNAPVSVDPITGEVISDRSFEFGDKFMRHITAGAELILGENLQIQLGYNYKRRQELKIDSKPGTAGMSWGFGYKVKRFRLSYGRAAYHLAGPSNHFSISTNI